MPTEKKAISTKWETTTQRYVGYIDIMGFKDRVMRNNHEKIYEMMLKVSQSIKESIRAFGLDYLDKSIENIKMMTYSDSIMVYSRDSSPECLENFLDCISDLSYDLFLNRVPHKGSVAFGTMTLDFDNAIFFGQPLIDAYLLQEELCFYGIVAHSSIETKRGFKQDENVFNYNCKFKNGNAFHYVVLPAFLDERNKKIELNFQYDEFIKKIGRLRSDTSGHLRKYIDYTIEFVKNEQEERNTKKGNS